MRLRATWKPDLDDVVKTVLDGFVLAGVRTSPAGSFERDGATPAKASTPAGRAAMRIAPASFAAHGTEVTGATNSMTSILTLAAVAAAGFVAFIKGRERGRAEYFAKSVEHTIWTHLVWAGADPDTLDRTWAKRRTPMRPPPFAHLPMPSFRRRPLEIQPEFHDEANGMRQRAYHMHMAIRCLVAMNSIERVHTVQTEKEIREWTSKLGGALLADIHLSFPQLRTELGEFLDDMRNYDRQMGENAWTVWVESR